MDSSSVLQNLNPSVDRVLAKELFDEFVDIEKRYMIQDWEPATLNGGQFVEILSRILYHLDSGNLNRNKSVDSCLTYIEDQPSGNPHAFSSRREALHFCRVLRTIYKFRSQRGAIHIDPNYTANELDSSLIISLSRWAMAEFLRIFWQGDRAQVSKTIREIVRYEVPAILASDEGFFVLRTDCSVDEEILLLLHRVGEVGLSRSDLGKSIPKPAPQVTKAIQRLDSSRQREIIQKGDGKYILTPNGTKRIVTDLSQKLRLE